MSAGAGEPCANCGALVTGAYCSACGQRVQNHVLSLREFLGEAAEVLTHADSRFWRTFVPLLFRPGYLTLQFIKGRRVSFLPPFRLYFILSVVFFLVVSLTSTIGATKLTAPAAGAKVTADIRAELQKAIDSSDDPQERALLRGQLERLDKLSDTLAPGAKEDAAPACSKLSAMQAAPAWMRLRLVTACDKTRLDHGRGLGLSLVHNLGRAMFLLLPLIAAVMKLMYWRQQRLYVEHLLLLLHNHAFVFLSLSVLMIAAHFLVSDAWAGTLGVVLAIYIAWYLYLSMRRVYGQGWIITLFKCGALTFVYACCALLLFLLTTIYSFVTL
jgi:hypothetical protein